MLARESASFLPIQTRGYRWHQRTLNGWKSTRSRCARQALGACLCGFVPSWRRCLRENDSLTSAAAERWNACYWAKRGSARNTGRIPNVPRGHEGGNLRPVRAGAHEGGNFAHIAQARARVTTSLAQQTQRLVILKRAVRVGSHNIVVRYRPLCGRVKGACIPWAGTCQQSSASNYLPQLRLAIALVPHKFLTVSEPVTVSV